MSEPSSEGGDPACWLDEVCPECGAIPDGEDGCRCPDEDRPSRTGTSTPAGDGR